MPNKKKPKTVVIKRPLGEKLADILNVDEAKDWLKKNADISARKYIYELALGLLQKICFKNNTNVPRTFIPGSTGGMIPYNTIMQQQVGTSTVSTMQTSSLEWATPGFRSLEDIDAVIMDMQDYISKTGYVTMREFYDLSNQPKLINSRSSKYGFREINPMTTYTTMQIPNPTPEDGDPFKYIIKWLIEPIRLS